MPTDPEFWSASIAGLALVLSLTSLWWQWSSRRYADPVVSFSTVDDMTYVTLENFGAVVARDVAVDFEIPEGRPEPRLVAGERGAWPIPFLAPAHPVSYPCLMVIGMPATFEATVTWRDGRMRQQSRRVTLGIGRARRTATVRRERGEDCR